MFVFCLGSRRMLEGGASGVFDFVISFKVKLFNYFTSTHINYIFSYLEAQPESRLFFYCNFI